MSLVESYPTQGSRGNPPPLPPITLLLAIRLHSVTRELEEMRARVRAERAYMRRSDIAPTDKVIALDTAWELGFAPDSPNPQRPEEWQTVYRARVAGHLGVSEARVGATWQAMTAATWVRSRTLWEKDATTGEPRRRVQLAPPEGLDWQRTWADPVALPPLPKPERLAKDAATHAERRSEQNAVVAAARVILAQCPECGSQDVDLRCHECGTITPLAALPDAPTVQSDDSSLSAPSPLVGKTSLSRCDDSSLWDGEEGEAGEEACAGPSYTPPEALAGAVAVLTPAVLPFPTHLAMQTRQAEAQPKYLSVAAPLTPELLSDHLLGHRTLGAGLCWVDEATGERQAWAIAWDSDEDLGRLIRAAARLRRRGLSPLLVKNPTKIASGHLWLLFGGPVDPTGALAAAEQIAPELASIPERFPSPTIKDGGRLRLPGGRYRPIGAPPVSVHVALAPEIGAPVWVEGTTAEGWATIATAVSPPAALQATWVPPQKRPCRARASLAIQPRVRRAAGGEDFFARFNAEHPIGALVDVDQRGYFHSPWHPDSSPSCKLYPNGTWCDFSWQRRGGDAYDLWCALNGFWAEVVEKPDRKGAYRQMCGKGQDAGGEAGE